MSAGIVSRGTRREAVRAVAGAAAAVLAGGGIGLVARIAHAAGTARPSHATSGARLSHVVAGARAATPPLDWATMDARHAWTRLVTSLDGTGPVFAQLALVALLVVAVLAAARAVALWRSERRRGTTVATPAVQRLAESGASAAEIARRTGLSRDAVALAMYLR